VNLGYNYYHKKYFEEVSRKW